MSDTPPIVVPATPTKEQIETGIQLVLTAVGSVAAALGFMHVAGDASALIGAAGAVAAAAAFIWGQIATRISSKQKTAMAEALPDHIARAE